MACATFAVYWVIIFHCYFNYINVGEKLNICHKLEQITDGVVTFGWRSNKQALHQTKFIWNQLIGTNNLAIRKNYIRKTKKCRLIFHLWNNFQIFISEFVVFFSFSNPKMLIYVCLICSNDGIQMTLFLCLNYARKNPFLYLILIKCLYSQPLKYLLWLLWKILCRNNIKYFMFWLMILLLIHH